MKKVSPHPFKNFRTNRSKINLSVHIQTVDASRMLALALANGQVAKRRERNE